MNLLYLVLVLYTLYFVAKVLISLLQIRYVLLQRDKDSVLLSPSEYKLSASYEVAKEKLDAYSFIVDFIVFMFWIFFGLTYLNNIIRVDNIFLKSIIFLDSFVISNYIFSLPFNLYETFVLEKKYGFNKTNFNLYLLDTLKNFILFLIFGSSIFLISSFIIYFINNWWIFIFLFLLVAILIVNFLYPTVISPIFNKFSPLQREDLTNGIKDIFKQAGYENKEILVMDASRRNAKVNAYFTGFGKFKRVVLFDTLLKKLSANEILSVLSHELGHFKNRDVMKSVLTLSFILFLVCALFGNLPSKLFFSIGIPNTPYMQISIFMMLSSLVFFIVLPILVFISRKNEYRADSFSVSIRGKDSLISALLKITEENKKFPKSHPAKIFFYFSHPPIIKRISAIKHKKL